MKLLALVLLALVAGVALALFALNDPGHVILNIRGYTVETSVALLILVSIVVFIVLYYVIRLISTSRHAPAKISGWIRRRQRDKAQKSLLRGLLALTAGEWENAEQALLSHVSHCDKPALNYIAAARAAQQQGAHERRDRYLKTAHQLDPSAATAVSITQAELQLNQGQYEQALATLKRLHAETPRNRLILKLLAHLYLKLKDWERFIELLPTVRKYRVIGEKDCNHWQQQAHLHLLISAGKTQERRYVSESWQRVPKPLRHDPELVAEYARQLAACGDIDEAIRIIDQQVSQHASSGPLMRLYGQLQGSQVLTQLVHAERWLNEEHETPELFLTLGQLAIANEMWAKARDYLKRAVALNAGPQAYQLLGLVLTELGEVEAANDTYRLGLDIVAHQTGEQGRPHTQLPGKK